MSMHPAITAALADQHRRDLIAQADAQRLARAARPANPTWRGPFRVGHHPALRAKAAKRAVAATGAVFAAAAVLMASPAGTIRWDAPHASAAHFRAPQVSPQRWA